MKPIRKWYTDVSLLAIMVLSAFLNGYNIWKDEYANTYYTTAVGSMLQSFHNFFYASLDSAGSVTVDKPPLTFWIQTISAYVFGLHGWSVILPQALAGVGSVLMVYLLVRPTFGIGAARLSALVMASTPIAVAVARTNNIDSMLVFTLLLAAYLLFKGIRSGSVWSVLGGFAVIGLGFNMKMMQAYMVVPAFVLFVLLAFRASWLRKAGLLAGSLAVMLVVSLSWAVVVDAIPQDQRPYIGSSQTNSVLELALGYNGVSRLTGDRGPGAGMPGRSDDGSEASQRQSDGRTNGERSSQQAVSAAAPGQGGFNGGQPGQPPGMNSSQPGQPPGMGNGGQQGQPPGMNGSQDGNRGGGMFNTGTKGPLRLFQSELSGQASWLLPLVGFACVGLFASFRRRNFTAKHKEALFWLGWLVPVMGFFSIAGFFHQYYLIMLAPPIAALAGAGGMELWRYYRARSGRFGWLGWLLPAAVLATAAFEWYIVHPYDSRIGSGWSTAIGAGGFLAALLLTAFLFLRRDQRIIGAVAAAGLAVLLVGPVYWAATPITYGQNSQIPEAGPGSNNGGRNGFGPGGGGAPNNAAAEDGRNQTEGNNTANRSKDAAAEGADNGGQQAVPAMGSAANPGMPAGGPGGEGGRTVNETLLKYLREHNDGKTYLFAATDYNTAAPYIVKEGEKVVILNGFSGSDKVYTTETLEALVRSGKVQYFLLSGGGMGGGGRGGNSDLTQWITTHGTLVSSEELQASSGGGSEQNGRSGSITLYKVSL